MATLAIKGQRKNGQEIRDENATAVAAVANVVRNTLGPAGLDKVIVDDVGDLTITNDGATILKLIELHHPAARILVELAQLQDNEVGDGTTSVVLLAAELIRRGNQLVKNSIHPTTVISGFQQARKAACKFLAENLVHRTDSLGDNCLLGVAKTAMSSKVIGGDAQHFAAMAVEAIKRIGRGVPKKPIYDVRDIGIIQLRGNRLADSELIDGLAIIRNRSLSSFGMPSKLENAKIAFIDFDLRKEKLPFNIKVTCTNPDELESIRAKETSIVENRISILINSGATAILSSRAIDDFALSIIASKNLIALKNIPRAVLKRAANASGGHLLNNLASLDNRDCADRLSSSSLGFAPLIFEKQIGDIARLIIIKTPKGRGQTMLLRGPSDGALEEAERSFHDVLCALKRVLESRRIVVGGGVTEASLSVYLENFAETIGSRDQLAISEFASALLTIPKTLISNSAFDCVRLVSALRAAHNNVIRENNEKLRNVGLNLENGVLRDNLKAGVLEPAMSKIKAIKFATEAAVAILRIDDSISPRPENPNGMYQ